MRLLCLLSILLCFQFGNAQGTANNEISGVVTLPIINKKIKRGSGYNRDGSPVMHSNDPMASFTQNVIISLHPQSFTPKIAPLQDATITQREQTFLPHVLPVTKGSTVYFLNEDEFFHNIYSLSPGSRFNIGRRPPGSPYPIKIKKVGPIKLSCDIHPHMSGIILSLETPYFTRLDDEGRFHLSNLPDGIYTLKIYHPLLAKEEHTIRLQGGMKMKKDFDIKNKRNR